MKKNKILFIFITILIFFIIFGIFYIKKIKSKNEKIKEEYIPEKEISEEKTRKTIITLYFLDKAKGEIIPEPRLINIKEIIKNPEKKLVELIIEGPKNEKLNKILPKDVQILDIKKEGDICEINFSKEMLNINKENIPKIKECIEKTLIQLKEINKINILIEGKK